MPRAIRLSRAPATDVAYGLIFLAGVYLRVRFVLFEHDPREFIHDNAKLYIWLAQRLAAPGFSPRPVDVFVPPGTPFFFSFFYARDSSLTLAAWAMLALTVLIPLVVGGLGWAAFGRTTGKVAMAISCVYFPFIEYGGHFLSETPFTFVFSLTMLLFLVAIRRPGEIARFGWALAAGLSCSVAIAFKVVALPAMASALAAYLLFFREPGGAEIASSPRSPAQTRSMRALVAAGVVLGALPLVAAMSVRCTRANQGRVCFVSSKGPSDFLLGHYGRFDSLAWMGENAIWASSASAAQHGYKGRPVVPFDLTDGPANSAAAWHWIGAHPGEALVLSCEHVYDLLCGSLPSPAIDTASWLPMEASHFAFVLLLLLPSAYLVLDLAKTQGLRGFLGRTEGLVAAPFVGVAAAVFVATGEARYRIPFDPLFILLAIQSYRRWGESKRPSIG